MRSDIRESGTEREHNHDFNLPRHLEPAHQNEGEKEEHLGDDIHRCYELPPRKLWHVSISGL